ncbi:CDP-glycerol glycerophosphotransferase family protein [Bacillus sp. FJAT-29790]|uniref:CDP-glycerol glycerophosphotransferase family protein n=1 Tax=Bacillus sp. FJAT-29790 TaxID=1895002 RepID=UPI001C230AFD|nr:CDP-glycerol glycerophosphotransferase family protein [Bacillus sp. FJAT-29790]MBU8881191.1 CDP-glycerol glycerophosphotransferase family protein [Bacillus sp. FJAT-29790]
MSKIGFVCTTIFHHIHFKSIYEQFEQEGIFIIVPNKFNENRYKRLVEYFEVNQIPFCSVYDIVAEQVKIDTIIAPYWFPFFQFIPSKIKRIRLLYGYAKDAWNYADWNKAFDLALVYGAYAEERLKDKVDCVSIGHPRFFPENLLQINTDIKDVKGRSLKQWYSSSNDSFSTVLYCPTWGNLTSIEIFQQVIEKINLNNRIIIKLHHNNVLNEKLDLSGIYENNNLFVCDEKVDIFDLFPAVDVVLSDYSGAIFDAILARKKILLLDVISSNIRDTGIENLRLMKNISSVVYDNESYEKTNSVSLDIAIRSFTPHIFDLSELNDKLQDVIYSENQTPEKIINHLYRFQDGHTPDRAKYEILRVKRGELQVYRKHEYDLFENRLDPQITKMKNRDIVIWGAGELGHFVFYWLFQNKLKPTMFVDSDINKIGEKVEDISIFTPSWISDIEKPFIIVATSYGNKDVSFKLKEMGYEENLDYFCPF